MNVDLYKVSEEVAHDLVRPLDHALKVKIRAMFIEQRAFHLRRNIQRAGSLDPAYFQTFFTPITTSNLGHAYSNNSYDCVAKTLENIPSPIILDIDSPFQDVTSQDGSIIFAHTKLSSLKFNNITTCTKNVPRYTFINNNVYIYFSRKNVVPIQGLLFTGVWENPIAIRDYNNDADYYEFNFPLPLTLVSTIKQYIIEHIGNNGNDDKDITLDGIER